eukprot:7158825-Ditylum_brightwellii.AAC.1
MSGDLPLVDTCFPVIVIKYPTKNPTAAIEYSIEGNCAKAFVYNAAMLQIHSITPEETKCSNLFCDEQCLHEIHAQGCGHGCYHMFGRQSNIALDH